MSQLPTDFLEHMLEQGLPAEQLEEFKRACQRPLRRSIRVNTLKISIEAFIKRVTEQYQWQLTPIPWCAEGFWLQRPDDQEANQPLGNVLEHLQGLFYIQEASSMLPAQALLCRGGTPDSAQDEILQASESPLLLDMAAAPGSKTTQLAARLNNNGVILANELSSSRLKGLFSNLQRCGVINTCLTHMDGVRFGETLPEHFDAILLDAPCGGEGTVRKDLEALNEWNLGAVEQMAVLQKRLIVSAFQALKPGGILVYSTCTLSKEENQRVCEHLLNERPDADVESLCQLFNGASGCATVEGFLHVYPHIYDSEGFFVARFRKKAHAVTKAHGDDANGCRQKNSAQKKNGARRGRFPYQPATDKEKQQIADHYLRHFAMDLPWHSHRLWKRDNSFWLFPQQVEQLIGKIKLDRIGFKLCEQHGKVLRTTHEAATALGDSADRNCLELTAESALTYLQGKDLFLASTKSAKGELLLRFNGAVLGLGKNLPHRIKNSLQRDLVRDNPVCVGAKTVNEDELRKYRD